MSHQARVRRQASHYLLEPALLFQALGCDESSAWVDTTGQVHQSA